MRIGIMAIAVLVTIVVSAGVARSDDVIAAGRRVLPAYEADAYGPLPFSEVVTGFLDHEIRYILKRQNKDGSWDSAQPKGNGRTVMQAGGTVGNVTLTSMCGYSLRKYMEHDPDTIEDSVARALRFVTQMINAGKLRNNVMDGPWHYIYALRFLVSEYPRVKDATIRKQVEVACAVIIRGLKDTQSGTYGQRSMPFRWEKRSNSGLVVADTDDGLGRVIQCDAGSPTHTAGLRVGDRMLTANGVLVDTAVRYALAEPGWLAGTTVAFMVTRQGKQKTFRIALPPQYPGTLGFKLSATGDAVSLTGFAFLSNRDLTPLKAGDQLLKIDDQLIRSEADIDKLSFFAGQKVKLQIQRGTKVLQFDYVCAPSTLR